jgi:hypothetical protein
MRLHLNQWLDTVAHSCHPSYSGNTNRRVAVQASLIRKQDSISQITNTKRVDRVAQVVEEVTWDRDPRRTVWAHAKTGR